MKVVILAGCMCVSISEEPHLKPKHMIEISVRPIIRHIMKIYFRYGFTYFITCFIHEADRGNQL